MDNIFFLKKASMMKQTKDDESFDAIDAHREK